MSAAESIRQFLTPLLPGWLIQFGHWNDKVGAKTSRFAVLKPAGGSPAELLRRPQFTLALIGEDGGDAVAVNDAASSIVEAMRASSGDLVFMQPAEPVYLPTSDGRPVFEIAISAITT